MFAKLFVALMALAVSGMCYSANLVTVEDIVDNGAESVLTPGAKLVAGDAKKNEFYILGQNEASPKQTETPEVATNDATQAAAQNPPLKNAKVIVNSQIAENAQAAANEFAADKPPVANKKVASQKAKLAPKFVVDKKIKAKVKLAMSKKHHQLADKATVSKIKSAFGKHHAKVASKSTASRSRSAHSKRVRFVPHAYHPTDV